MPTVQNKFNSGLDKFPSDSATSQETLGRLCSRFCLDLDLGDFGWVRMCHSRATEPSVIDYLAISRCNCSCESVLLAFRFQGYHLRTKKQATCDFVWRRGAGGEAPPTTMTAMTTKMMITTSTSSKKRKKRRKHHAKRLENNPKRSKNN